MNETFLTFKVFNDSETAQDFAEVLKQNHIPYFIEEDAVVFDPSYANNQFNKDFRLKLRPQDFQRGNQVIEEYYYTQLDTVDKDYYLFDFTDEELQEIVAKPDEWGQLDYLLAQKLLTNRGKEIKSNEIQELKVKRINELATPDTVKHSSIIWGYILGFFFFPLALLMGWSWGFAKRTLPTGQRIYMYDSYAQLHGRRIFIMGIILLVLSIALRTIVALFEIEN